MVRRCSHLLSRSLDADTQIALKEWLRGFATSIGDGLLEYEETTCVSSDRTNEATGLVVHGLLGSGRNWRSFSRALTKDLAQSTGRPWRIWLVDLRCHGKSLRVRGLKPPSTVAASAADIGRLLDARLQGVRIDAILGHSLGGKVVMDLLAQRKDCPPSNQVWVLDSVVGVARPDSGEPSDVKRVLEEVEKIKMPVQSRDWLYQHLESRGFSQGFRLWMGSNLQIRDGQYHWAFHVKCAQELYESYQESEYWEVAREPPAGVTLNVVRAAKSDRWTDKQWGLLREAAAASKGRLKLHTLPKAGHWLHADNPEGLRRLLATHIAAAKSE